MSKRMTAERLAEMELRAETLELDTRTWSDRDELLQALKAEYAMVKRLISISLQLRERLEAEKAAHLKCIETCRWLQEQNEELEAALKAGCEDMANECPARTCGLAETLQSRIEALEATVKLADKLINGNDTSGGLVWCMDGYYGDCFTDDLKEWNRLMEQEDE